VAICRQASACVIGPGMGRDYSTRRLIVDLIPQLRNPAVVDADGLNAIADQRGRFAAWRARPAPPQLVLTPHPAEMSRLTGMTTEAIEADREAIAKKFATEWAQVIVLKGANTVIAAPDGRVSINPHRNPALATAGTGDVLAGIIGGLLAQGLDPFTAAVTGTFLHGAAAEEASARIGDTGMLASDLLPAIPAVIRRLRPMLAGRPAAQS
jgi:NAD(P)H-hydrate epimerase